MADKTIDELTAATTMGNDDLLVLQQGGTAKKLSGKQLGDYVYNAAAEKVAEVNKAVDDARESINNIVESVQSMTELGTDTTLTTTGMAADAKAAGDKIKAVETAALADLSRGTAIESMIAGRETAMEVTKNYISGSLVIVNDTLYKLDANVASGESLIPEINCHITTVAAVITSRVPSSRIVNGKALSSDITLTAEDISYDDSLSSHTSGSVGEAVSNLKESIKTSGILVPPFELGNISYTTSSWGTYTNSTSRVRVPSGSEVELNGGDIIYCDSSIVAYLSVTADDVHWNVLGWLSGAIIAPVAGKYSFLLRKQPESAITNINDVISKFAILSGNMANIFFDMSNMVNIIGLEDSLIRSYINHSTHEEIRTGSNIFTRKFINPTFKKIKVFGISNDTSANVLSFYSTDKAEASSYISGIRYLDNSQNGMWYMADVPSNCKMVAVTSRSDGNPIAIDANADILTGKIVSSYYNKPSFFIPAKPRIIKHGGDSNIAPENSLPLFNLAGSSGYWGIETDLRLTSDNVLVCMHDTTIDRTTNGTGAVASMTYEDLQNYTIDVGDYTKYTAEELRVPTFEEYLKVCRKYGCVAIIEIYNLAYQGYIIDIIKKMGMEDSCIIMSFTTNNATNVRAWSKKIPFIQLYVTGSTLSTEDIDNLPPNAGFAVGADANGDVETYTQNLLDYARANNRYTGVWTVNDVNIEKWEDAGVDMITVYSKS